jgi:hypothetical protein
MDFINDLLSGRAEEFTQLLADNGFSLEEAARFLPEAGQSVSDAASSAGMSLLGSGSPVETLLAQLDIGALAEKVGIAPELAEQGLQALLPVVTEALGGEEGALGSLLSGGLGGMMKRFF